MPEDTPTAPQTAGSLGDTLTTALNKYWNLGKDWVKDPINQQYLRLLAPAAIGTVGGGLFGGARGMAKGLAAGAGLTLGGWGGRKLFDYLNDEGYLKNLNLSPNTLATIRLFSPIVGSALGAAGGIGLANRLLPEE